MPILTLMAKILFYALVCVIAGYTISVVTVMVVCVIKAIKSRIRNKAYAKQFNTKIKKCFTDNHWQYYSAIKAYRRGYYLFTIDSPYDWRITPKLRLYTQRLANRRITLHTFRYNRRVNADKLTSQVLNAIEHPELYENLLNKTLNVK